MLERSGLGWEHLRPYREFVARIAASPFAGTLFALRSLDFLVVSPTRGWVKKGPRWVDWSRVLLRPCRDERVSLTLVKKRKGQPWESETVECPFDGAWQVLEPWLRHLQEEAVDRGAAPERGGG
jgi:hypothetical protein